MKYLHIIKKYFFLSLIITISVSLLEAQTISKQQMIFLTSLWEGERFDDGRPKVSDDVLDRMKTVTIEELGECYVEKDITISLKVIGNLCMRTSLLLEEH